MRRVPIEIPRVGIVSFAHYHANFWAEALNADALAELAGIWDDNPARGEQAAAQFGCAFYPSLDGLLADCHAVAVCSETSRHVEHVCAAAALGRHVLCEKPIAVDVASALHIRDAVDVSGIVYMQSFPKRFDPVSHELKRMVDSGQLGRVHLARVRHGHYHGLDSDFIRQWYMQPALSGGGALLDEGVHAADFLCWIFGVPDTVTATLSAATAGLAAEDTGIAVYAYKQGLLAEIVSSCVFQAADASIEIYGDQGTAIVAGVDLASRDLTADGHLKVFHATQAERVWQVSDTVPRFKAGEFHHQNLFNFTSTLREGTPPPVSVDDGIRALSLIEAAYAAARTGSRQTIDIEERLR